MVRLGEVVELNPKGDRLSADDSVSFVGMAELNATTAEATPLETRPYAAVAKGYTSFRNGDLLAAKITPCWENGKVGQAKIDHDHGFGSTEFHVLRPGPQLDTRYLLHFMRQDSVRQSGQLRMTGSGGQRRVPTSFLASLGIPLPPLAEQRRIAAILDQADTVTNQYTRRIELAVLLEESVYRETVANSTMPPVNLGDVATFHAGSTLPAGVEFLHQDRGFLLMRVSDMNLAGNEKYISRTSQWAAVNSGGVIAPPGAIVFPKRGASIATNKKRILSRPTALDPNLMAIAPTTARVSTQFMFAWMESFDLASISSGSSVPQLNKKDLNRLAIPELPPETLALFDRIAYRFDSMQVESARQVAEARMLFGSLQSRAFRGEL